MATATLNPARVETTVRRTFSFPVPPAPPEPAKFTHYAIYGRRHTEATHLASAADRWLEQGTDAELFACAEHWVPGDGDDCGSFLFRSRYNPERDHWEPWKPE